MKKLRVMMLVHWSLVPPEDLRDPKDPRMEKYHTEYDVKTALETLGHEVRILGIHDDIASIRKTVEEWQPHIAFNLLEDFAGVSAFDYYVVSFLEMMRLPYTGCNPRGLLLARDKALSKKILGYHRVNVPDFMVFARGRKIGRLRRPKFPLIVKARMEEGSVGIAQSSYVENEPQLRELAFNKPEAGAPRMATYKVKWDEKYRERWGVEYQFVRALPNGGAERIERLCKRVYRLLDMSGYGRIDLRLTAAGAIYVLEANPNPGIARDEDCALSAAKAGLDYANFIQRLLNLGLAAHQGQEES